MRKEPLWQPPSKEEKRENNSAHSLLVHVFTQPGSKAALTAPKTDFRFTPESGLNSDIAPSPKSAISGSHSILVATGEIPGCDGHSGNPARRNPSSYRERSSACQGPTRFLRVETRS